MLDPGRMIHGRRHCYCYNHLFVESLRNSQIKKDYWHWLELLPVEQVHLLRFHEELQILICLDFDLNVLFFWREYE